MMSKSVKSIRSMDMCFVIIIIVNLENHRHCWRYSGETTMTYQNVLCVQTSNSIRACYWCSIDDDCLQNFISQNQSHKRVFESKTK